MLMKCIQKQPFRGVLRKICSENMQQSYRKTPMPHTSAWVFSSQFAKFSEHLFLGVPHEGCFCIWSSRTLTDQKFEVTSWMNILNYADLYVEICTIECCFFGIKDVANPTMTESYYLQKCIYALKEALNF